MHSPQDRIEAKRFAVSRVWVLTLGHDFIPLNERLKKKLWQISYEKRCLSKEKVTYFEVSA
jgi:hypothetical protein